MVLNGRSWNETMTLARIVDIGTELAVMALTTARAQTERNQAQCIQLACLVLVGRARAGQCAVPRLGKKHRCHGATARDRNDESAENLEHRGGVDAFA